MIIMRVNTLSVRKINIFSNKNSKLLSCGPNFRSNVTAASQLADAEQPKYPPILTPEERTTEFIEKQKWHNKITRLPTYEQKVLELNMPKGYGHYSCMLDDAEYNVHGRAFLEFVTRTQVEEDGLPQHYYKEVSGSSIAAAERLAPLIEQLVTHHFLHTANRSNDQSGSASTCFLRGLHRLLSSCLPQPQLAKIVTAPRLNAFWLAGGVQSVGTERPEWAHFKEEEREKRLWVRNLYYDREEPYLGDLAVSSRCSPILGVRERLGLPPVTDAAPRPVATPSATPESSDNAEDAEDNDESSPQDTWAGCRLHPESIGYPMKHVPAMLLSGYWPGERNRHYRVLYHAPHYRTHLRQEPTSQPQMVQQQLLYPTDESSTVRDALIQQLIVASHTQALGQAAMFGFGPVSELTYPVVQQSVVTDGQTYTLSLHQCSTVALHDDRTTVNDRVNKIWVSPEQRLFSGVDATSGKVLDLNLSLVAQLAAMYQKETAWQNMESPNLAPYKYLWNHPNSDDWSKEKFLNRVHRLTAGRSWFHYKPELYAWEKLYKLDNNTMPVWNNNKRFFEGHHFRMLPQDRTIQHYHRPCIRVADRPLGKRDPLKREPIIDSELLFDKRKKGYRNWRYERY